MPALGETARARGDGEILTAVIVGAGVAGLTSAAAALKHFDSVVLIDRDDLTGTRIAVETPLQTEKRRAGVSQYIQPHALAAGGGAAMELLLPGFKAAAVQRGAQVYDAGAGLSYYDFDGHFTRKPMGLESYNLSRRLLNETLQDMLIEQGGERLTIRDKTKVPGLLWGEGNKSINGVVLSSGEEILADLVIMADGRKTKLPSWLKEAKVKLPPLLKVDCKCNYAARWMRLPNDFDPNKECYAHLCYGRRRTGPHSTRGGIFLVIEERLVQVVLSGMCGERAPLDEEGWLAYASSLPDPTVRDIIVRCEPVTPIARYAGVPNLLPQYHKTKLPAGVVVVGDAMMALNPIYGQGMGVAAIGAVTLDRCMGKALPGKRTAESRRTALRSMGPWLQKKLHKQAAIAWSMATAEDTRYEGAEVEGVASPPALLSAYFDSLTQVAQRDPAALKQLFEVGQLMDPPSKIFGPRIMGKTVAQMVRNAFSGKGRQSSKGEGAAGGTGGKVLGAADEKLGEQHGPTAA